MGTVAEVLAVASAACTIAAALLLLRLHLLPTGLRATRVAVSDYGTTRYHLYYRAMVVLLGLGAGLLTVELARDTRAGDLGLAFLAVFAAARIAIAAFITDPPGRPATTTGRIHLVLAAIAFTAIAFGAADITDTLDGTPGWSGGIASALRFTAHLIAVTAVLTAISRIAPALRDRMFGLCERLLYVAMLAWLLIAALHITVLAG